MMIKTSVVYTIALFGSLTGPALAAEGGPSGAELYKFHGCINCHGADAKNPVSKVVPDLAGKPVDEIYTKAKKIMGGEETGKESDVMHAAFYSPSQCDHPPTDVELQSISAWISRR